MGQTPHLAWTQPSAATKYGGALAAPPVASKDHAAAVTAAGPAMDMHTPPWSPHNPLFWVGVIAAASFGLMGYSTTVRVGSASAGIKLGTP